MSPRTLRRWRIGMSEISIWLNHITNLLLQNLCIVEIASVCVPVFMCHVQRSSAQDAVLVEKGGCLTLVSGKPFSVFVHRKWNMLVNAHFSTNVDLTWQNIRTFRSHISSFFTPSFSASPPKPPVFESYSRCTVKIPPTVGVSTSSPMLVSNVERSSWP